MVTVLLCILFTYLPVYYASYCYCVLCSDSKLCISVTVGVHGLSLYVDPVILRKKMDGWIFRYMFGSVLISSPFPLLAWRIKMNLQVQSIALFVVSKF